MKYIVNFSGGACSFLAAVRTIAKYGRENVILLFADVLIESPDLYEFNQTASKILGIPITRVSRELTPWELFRKEHMIGNDRAPICSIRLKREPLNEWMEANFEVESNQGNALFEPATIVLGFDWTEEHRVRGFQAEHPTWNVIAPMTEPQHLDKCKMLNECEKIGLTIPLAYRLGFPHNNCGNRCVRAGITHWVHLHRTQLGQFLEWENEELKTNELFAEQGISSHDVTILKDRRNGQTIPMLLRDLRLRIEDGEKFPEHEWGGCGCGA